MSLGVDLVPHKVCSLDCVYCECGKTTKLTTDRMEYILYDKVTAELAHFFENNPAPDYITFSGSGEPTLNSRIGDVLQFIKRTKPGIPVAVLTNGTLFYDKQVRSEILDADVVLPSLDAASQEVFDKINRPNQKLTVDEYIDGIVTFRNEYKGKIWLEVLIIPGYNDSESELILLKEAFNRIKPDSIQVNTLDRPGTVENLRSATRAELQRVVDFWDMENVEIISAAPDRKNIKSYREDIETAILETIFRRPCTVDDLVKILGRHINEVNKYLDVLEAEGKIEHVRQERGVFYKVVKS
jgi:wyosine [tRNA(Phe)-imidazoG37] synthetase (radical SAM superfamily)